MEAFTTGNPVAEKQMFLQYFKPLCFYAERIVGNLQQGEDIAVEVFLKLFDRKQHFTKIEAVRSFLYRSVRNASINFNSTKKIIRG